MTILHIDSSITGESSVSREISRAIVANLTAGKDDRRVIQRDLVAEPLPHLTLAELADGSVVDEFLAADTVVIGAPMYNFSVPTQLKALIDRILVSGKTFRYGASGPEGLAGDKRVIVALARGRFYGADTPAATMEHLESYLRSAFNFIGIEPQFVAADGVAIGPEQKIAALAQAHGEILELAAWARAVQGSRLARPSGALGRCYRIDGTPANSEPGTAWTTLVGTGRSWRCAKRRPTFSLRLASSLCRLL